MVHNEPGASLSCDIGPYPLQEDTRAQTGLRQELQMHSCPGEPGEEAADTNLPTLEYGKALTHDCEISFIEVAKRRSRWLSLDAGANQFGCILSLLQRNLSHAG